MTTYDATTSVEEPGKPCAHCGLPGYEHDKERVFPDHGPTGCWHWRYVCPGTQGAT